jgi:hypothetical protein
VAARTVQCVDKRLSTQVKATQEEAELSNDKESRREKGREGLKKQEGSSLASHSVRILSLKLQDLILSAELEDNQPSNKTG